MPSSPFIDYGNEEYLLYFVDEEHREWYPLEVAISYMGKQVQACGNKVFWIRNRLTDEIIPSTIV